MEPIEIEVSAESETRLRTISFNRPVYVSACSRTNLILSAEEYAALERAIADRAAEEAAASGDARPSCPVCGGPLPCTSCLTDLRCDP